MMNRKRNRLPAWLLAVALVASTAACADTEIQGVVKDEDLNTPDLMLPLARGINSEFGDLFVASVLQYVLDASTDGMTVDDTNNGTDETRHIVGDFRQRENASMWAQAHEAVWAVLFGDRRMQEVLPEEDYESSPLVSRIYAYGGHAERMLGETYCEVIYNYGKDGGILLGQPGPYDPSRTVASDSAFHRAIYMFERALEFAQRGVTAGREPPADEDPARPIFQPAHLVIASHAGLAQIHANLGDWDTAVQHARMVPDNFADWALHDGEVDGGNFIADNFYQDDDVSIYRTQGALLWPTDPRVALVKCGDWSGANMDNSANVPPTSAFRNMSAACGHLNGEFRSESNRYPLWISSKYPDDDADVEIASGAEMRLIEAEAALLDGNLGEFTAQVNRARAARGVGPIQAPATAGALEYPNTENDAWSILDRERYLELFLEGRRLWDLRRWEHPFVSGNHVLLPRYAADLPPGGRWDCRPIPEQECDTNASITCPNLAGG